MGRWTDSQTLFNKGANRNTFIIIWSSLASCHKKCGFFFAQARRNRETDGGTDGQTDGHTLVWRCEDASKKKWKIISKCRTSLITDNFLSDGEFAPPKKEVSLFFRILQFQRFWIKSEFDVYILSRFGCVAEWRVNRPVDQRYGHGPGHPQSFENPAS